MEDQDELNRLQQAIQTITENLVLKMSLDQIEEFASAVSAAEIIEQESNRTGTLSCFFPRDVAPPYDPMFACAECIAAFYSGGEALFELVRPTKHHGVCDVCSNTSSRIFSVGKVFLNRTWMTYHLARLLYLNRTNREVNPASRGLAYLEGLE